MILGLTSFSVVYWNHIYVDDEDRPDIKEKIIKFVMISAPHPSINMMTAILDSFLSSGIFSMFVFAILDEQSNKVKLAARPLLLTLTLIGIVMAFFSNSGVRLSPGIIVIEVCLLSNRPNMSNS